MYSEIFLVCFSQKMSGQRYRIVLMILKQSWNRSKFFGPDRTGRSDFSDRQVTGRSTFLTGPVKNRRKTGRS
jgi:hypothetical protein